MAAATYLALYRRTDMQGLLPAVLQHLEQSREQWGALSAAADGHYADDLVFGFRDKGHCGHWRDDLAVVERDLGVVKRLLEDREEEELTQGRVAWRRCSSAGSRRRFQAAAGGGGGRRSPAPSRPEGFGRALRSRCPLLPSHRSPGAGV